MIFYVGLEYMEEHPKRWKIMERQKSPLDYKMTPTEFWPKGLKELPLMEPKKIMRFFSKFQFLYGTV